MNPCRRGDNSVFVPAVRIGQSTMTTEGQLFTPRSCNFLSGATPNELRKSKVRNSLWGRAERVYKVFNDIRPVGVLREPSSLRSDSIDMTVTMLANDSRNGSPD